MATFSGKAGFFLSADLNIAEVVQNSAIKQGQSG
jgi:hypothetical protein